MAQDQAAELRNEWTRICIDIFACGGTQELAGAALVCHENVEANEAFRIAAYAFRTWRAILRTCAAQGKPVPTVDRERAAEVLAKVPAITLQAHSLGPIELIEPTPPATAPPSNPAETQETP